MKTLFNFDLKSRTEMITGPGKEEILKYLNESVNKNKFIFGPAGSGKTSIAITILNKIIGDNPDTKVLFLVYGNFLRGYIKQTVPNLSRYIESYEKFKKDLPYGESFEEKFNRCTKKYDYIIIDEAQDIHLDFIKNIHIITKYVFILGDNSQRIFKSEKSFNGENSVCLYENVLNKNMLWSNHITNFLNIENQEPLNWIRRYPENIHNFAIQFKNDNSNYKFSKGKIEEYNIITYYKEANQENEILRIVKLIKDIQESEPNSTIGIILDLQTKVKYLYEELIKKGIDCTKYTNNTNKEYYEENKDYFKSGGEKTEKVDETYYSPFITTISSSKGTDADYIILPNIVAPESYCPEGKSYNSNCINNIYLKDEHYYVLSTRAKKKIFITGHGSNLNLELKIRSGNFGKNTYKTIDNSNNI